MLQSPIGTCKCCGFVPKPASVPLRCLVLALPHPHAPTSDCTTGTPARFVCLPSQEMPWDDLPPYLITLNYGHFYLMALILGSGEFRCCGYWASVNSSQLPWSKLVKKPPKVCRGDPPLSAAFTHSQSFGVGFFGNVKPQVQKKKPGATRDRITIKDITVVIASS